MGIKYMAGNPHDLHDDYTIEEKDTKEKKKVTTSPYNATLQYQSVAKQKKNEEISEYGLKNPIKQHGTPKRGRPLERDIGYGRD